jgi:hypothetical protein
VRLGRLLGRSNPGAAPIVFGPDFFGLPGAKFLVRGLRFIEVVEHLQLADRLFVLIHPKVHQRSRAPGTRNRIRQFDQAVATSSRERTM